MAEPNDVLTTRTAYDTVAASYEELLRDELAAKPLDRALLGMFAELVGDSGPVADLGCGPGRVTAYLGSLGVSAFGVDLSPGMVAVARRRHPGLRFAVGSMAALDLPDGSVGGVLAWYSIIHTPPDRLPGLLAEFHRVLMPGGHLLLAFQTGDERVHLDRGYGHDIALDVYRLDPDHIVALLDRANLPCHTRTLRAPGDRERTPQAYLLARKAAGTGDT